MAFISLSVIFGTLLTKFGQTIVAYSTPLDIDSNTDTNTDTNININNAEDHLPSVTSQAPCAMPLKSALKSRKTRPTSTQHSASEEKEVEVQGKERVLSATELVKYGEIQSRRLRFKDQEPDNNDPFTSVDRIISLPPAEPLQISDEMKAELQRQREIESARVAEYNRKQEEAAYQQNFNARAKERGRKKVRMNPMFLPLKPEWAELAIDTLRASDTVPLVKTLGGVGLTRRDFATIVQRTNWLNDEIINGSLQWIERISNWMVGIDDYKRETRKCLVMNSFFFTRLLQKGTKGTEATMRRCGVTRDNFYGITDILMPICYQNHWTLFHVNPVFGKIRHLDSLNPKGSTQFVKIIRQWLADFLQEDYVAEEWKEVPLPIPRQTNGYDCGMHVIMNSLCIAVGVPPIRTYKSEEIPEHRLRIAGMLLNGGFTGDFSFFID